MVRYLLLSLVLVSTQSFGMPSVEDVFRKQTFSLFSEEHISLVVSNGTFFRDGVGYFYEADLVIKVLVDRPLLIDGVSHNLLDEFVSYRFPVGSMPADATASDEKQAREILSRGVADGIVRATLGSNDSQGDEVARPGSKVYVFRDDAGRFYLNILGAKVYVGD